jgi:hypothetical protein
MVSCSSGSYLMMHIGGFENDRSPGDAEQRRASIKSAGFRFVIIVKQPSGKAPQAIAPGLSQCLC